MPQEFVRHATPDDSRTSVLIVFRTHQTLYLLRFDEKKLFQYSLLAHYSWVFALVCFGTSHELSERINNEYTGTTVFSQGH